MTRRSRTSGDPNDNTLDYRHDSSKRKNIPPAGLAAQGTIGKESKIEYSYNPHLSPILRFDPTGAPDKLPELIAAAGERPLTPAEQRLLAEALRNNQPWLEWSGKREEQSCVVDPIALNIHERVSTQAILSTAKREDVQKSLFADPEQSLQEALSFYRHDVSWSNRMVLGDSLSVMASLSRREALSGKVQMIYCDFPYGIKYASNFQPEVGKKDVKDKEEDLTREPEMIKAYRDTWTLGTHSYLKYVRDRLMLMKELLADTGSIFVQISDENVHRLTIILDEVFGTENHFSLITVKRLSPLGTGGMANVADYILWYAKDITKVKYQPIFDDKETGSESRYDYIVEPTGQKRKLNSAELAELINLPKGCRIFCPQAMLSSGYTLSCTYSFELYGKKIQANKKSWRTNQDGMARLVRSERLMIQGQLPNLIAFHADNPLMSMTNIWTDSGSGSTSYEKVYVVQTPTRQVQRCMLMTTDPGDLVLDPSLGGGTTAYVAEQWGRRWIGIDVSRVSLAIARQRLLTAKFDYYKLRPTSAEDVSRNPVGPWLTDPTGAQQGSCTFDCKTVPHITLKSIAQNQALDPIFDKWEPILALRLQELNEALAISLKSTPDLSRNLKYKYYRKMQEKGKRAVTDADERRLLLPPDLASRKVYTTVDKDFPGWYDWEVPFDTDTDWPEPMCRALEAYRTAWRQKMDEVDAAIAARADQEELVDQPQIVRNITRVSGPFTVEGVIPAEESIDMEVSSPVDVLDDEMETFDENSPDALETANAGTYLDKMISFLKADGVGFPNNRRVKFLTLERPSSEAFHGEGSWEIDGEEHSVAIVIGPQYGPLTSIIVEEAMRFANRRGYDDLVFAAFTFDGAAQAAIQEESGGRIALHMAQIRPDVNMGGLLKNTSSSHLFTVSGTPRIELHTLPDNEYQIEMQGVDIYDPVTNTIRAAGAEKVAAWFVDSDYDGRTFCITQAFFPDKSAWDKLARSLSGSFDTSVFEAFSGKISLPFTPGKHGRAAVKVIDPRGNEVMTVLRLGGDDQYA